MNPTEHIRDQIKHAIESNRIVLFMKGTQSAPRCGFSAQVCAILEELGVPFTSLDVLADSTLREEIKAFSNWPTIPQLYVDGQFIGGCDIVTELFQNGELNQLLGVPVVEQHTPEIQISDRAAAAFANASGDGDEQLRLEIGPGYEYDLLFDAPKVGDLEVTSNGVTLRMSRSTANRAHGVEIDFVDGPSGAGFKIQSPNEPAKVRSVFPKDLHKLLQENPQLELFDVRTDHERETAQIRGSRALDADGEKHLRLLEKNTPIFVYCHHGARSHAFAQQLVAAGYRNVYNLEGGIDAWSREVDSTVPRY